MGFWWILSDKDHRGWHDLMAGSKVVVKRNFLAISLLTMAILLVIDVVSIKAVWDKAESISRLYQEIIQDIGESVIR